MKLRRTFLRITRPVTRLMNRVNLRIGKPKLTGDMYRGVVGCALVGDIILTRTAWRPTNLFIPGYWSHAQMIVDTRDGSTVEATLPRCRFSSLVDIWASCSYVRVVRPVFASNDQMTSAAREARSYAGVTPYDLDFGRGDKALYCSELIVEAMLKADITVPDLRDKHGVIIPSRLADENHFETVFDSKNFSQSKKG